jgi:hypothetical protein
VHKHQQNGHVPAPFNETPAFTHEQQAQKPQTPPPPPASNLPIKRTSNQDLKCSNLKPKAQDAIPKGQ